VHISGETAEPPDGGNGLGPESLCGAGVRSPLIAADQGGARTVCCGRGRRTDAGPDGMAGCRAACAAAAVISFRHTRQAITAASADAGLVRRLTGEPRSGVADDRGQPLERGAAPGGEADPAVAAERAIAVRAIGRLHPPGTGRPQAGGRSPAGTTAPAQGAASAPVTAVRRSARVGVWSCGTPVSPGHVGRPVALKSPCGTSNRSHV
jgi:hypothetical protein